MENILKHKFIGIPTAIWVLQLLYVALALGLLAALSLKFHKQTHQLSFQIGYVLLMIVVDIAWRVAVKRAKPGWF